MLVVAAVLGNSILGNSILLLQPTVFPLLREPRLTRCTLPCLIGLYKHCWLTLKRCPEKGREFCENRAAVSYSALNSGPSVVPSTERGLDNHRPSDRPAHLLKANQKGNSELWLVSGRVGHHTPSRDNSNYPPWSLEALEGQAPRLPPTSFLALQTITAV